MIAGERRATLRRVVHDPNRLGSTSAPQGGRLSFYAWVPAILVLLPVMNWPCEPLYWPARSSITGAG
jgi:hypothetical protein